MGWTLDGSIYGSPERSSRFFMSIIAKHEPLHRLSVQLPPNVATISDKAHSDYIIEWESLFLPNPIW